MEALEDAGVLQHTIRGTQPRYSSVSPPTTTCSRWRAGYDPLTSTHQPDELRRRTAGLDILGTQSAWSSTPPGSLIVVGGGAPGMPDSRGRESGYGVGEWNQPFAEPNLSLARDGDAVTGGAVTFDASADGYVREGAAVVAQAGWMTVRATAFCRGTRFGGQPGRCQQRKHRS